MSKGEVLYNLNNLQIGEKIKVYSSGTDMYGNESVDIYVIERMPDGLYASYRKKKGFDEETEISFSSKIKTIGTATEPAKTMGLTKAEQEAIQAAALEERLIRRNYSLIGELEDGLRFEYPNIIYVEKINT
ncbi:MAG: hypothetical protein H0Z24_03320 [Thermosipho sp. (in: Bacteria)]|nr:hypothetical protein [Thermosipho sp. (in: thermotogales)]